MPDFNQMQRRRLAAKRQAMPDGGFPIRNVADLKNAIQAFGRAKNKPAVKAWIKKRARELGATDLLPDNWRDDTLVHYGIKGMKWGIRRTPAQLGHKASPKHRDATGRRDYASARISYRREKKKEDYDKRFTKDKERYKNNPEKLKRAKENYKTKMERIDTSAKTSAALREVGKVYVGNLARSTAYNVGSTFALTAVLAANPAAWPVAAGAAYAASIGVTGANLYKTYQGIRNTYSIATSKKKK